MIRVPKDPLAFAHLACDAESSDVDDGKSFLMSIPAAIIQMPKVQVRTPEEISQRYQVSDAQEERLKCQSHSVQGSGPWIITLRVKGVFQES
jgi:hypothetical protein